MQGDLFGGFRLKEKYDRIFNEAYSTLNERQKQAVDRIEGPVMVNAGPGTGKTQILAVRIGKILQDQDVAPHNILCLTYTDSATISMRNRLVEIVGPVAHKIHIHTFHGFCNQVIQENLDIFGGYKQLESISDLESVDVYRSIVDSIPDDNILKRYKGDKYFETKRLKHLFDLMKKENLEPDDVIQRLDKYLEEEKEDDQWIAKRGGSTKAGFKYKKGDFRSDKFEDFCKGFDNLRAAVEFFPVLREEMDKIERYDYNDMILWVLDAFKKDEELLARYQERYLYFLVDEFQDTNGSQNDLLSLLISYWEQPNVFVVGDDDQAIYKFQGANLNNIIDFKTKYDPFIVVLNENYRSNQHILDDAKGIIEFNTERLVNKDDTLEKELIARGKNSANVNKPRVLVFDKVSSEYAYLAKTLSEIHKTNPEHLQETAVIYRKHSQVEDLVNVLEKKNVPINIRRRVDILDHPLIRNLCNILWYLSDEYKRFGQGQHRLFEILHYNYWDVDSVDIGKIAMACQKRDEEDNYIEWRTMISDAAGLEQLNLRMPDEVLKASSHLEKWIKEIPEITIQNLFENVINEGGVLRYIMNQNNRSWLLQVLSTFFDFIKKETAKNPEMKLRELLQMLDKMKENKIPLSINKIISSEKGVHFITAHSAKGLEFDMVFMIGCTKNIWDRSMGSFMQFKYPKNLNADSKTNDEDERRLFYVAMTRAKTILNISYSQFKEDGKELGQSKFVDELLGTSDKKVERPEIEESDLAEFYYDLLRKEERTIPLIEPDLIDNYLKSYQMSVTHLNKFLKCPLSFYFESILCIPHARNASAGFGSAVHEALRRYFDFYNKEKKADWEKMEFFFHESIKQFKSHFTEE
ncbi:MAG: ATP-dependent helicase, partial [Bacteroidia bacterium]|nr:ATP-dependent helicase [Bacteroidia bacterium]